MRGQLGIPGGFIRGYSKEKNVHKDVRVAKDAEDKRLIGIGCGIVISI